MLFKHRWAKNNNTVLSEYTVGANSCNILVAITISYLRMQYKLYHRNTMTSVNRNHCVSVMFRHLPLDFVLPQPTTNGAPPEMSLALTDRVFGIVERHIHILCR